jgi:hypothetical protein
MQSRTDMSANQDQPPTFTESELPAISPAEFRIVEQEGRGPTLDVREGELEQVYNLGDAYACIMFVALCRREAVTVYRRPRQRSTTVCVRTTVSRHAQLWERFVVLAKQLEGKLAETTQQFVRDEVGSGTR